jgi:tRNA threonylcarbamoyladenosine biosynthesis protein TsaE
MPESDKTAGIIVTHSESETRELGRMLATILRPGDVLLLVGGLGTGKTCLAKGLASGLGVKERVLSPTFTLLREYMGRLPLYHLDAYRLEGPWDLYDIGVEEYLDGDGVLMVEWGDRARKFFGRNYLEIGLEFAGDEQERLIHLLPQGSYWEERLRELPGRGDVHGRL